MIYSASCRSMDPLRIQIVDQLERPVGTYLYGRRMYEVMKVRESLGIHREPEHIRDFAEIWRAADRVRTAPTSEFGGRGQADATSGRVGMAVTIWTIGHSTLPLEQFLDLLTRNRIEAVADVRRYPGSRRWPHFAREQLTKALEDRGLLYMGFPELGGRRTPRADSRNTGWRSAAFRGYADYMETEAFGEGLDRLVNLACGFRTAVLCAEALWWRCHRGLIADVLRWIEFEVYHIIGPGPPAAHPYTAAARLVMGRLSYSAAE